MHKNLPHEPQPLRLGALASGKRLVQLLGVGALLLGGVSARAQTPTTIFTETFEGATNSFTIANGTQANQWYVGTVGGNGPTTAGTRAAYVSNDGGVSNAYTVSQTSVTHMYRDVTIPAGQPVMQLSFDWKGVGESTFDYLQVFLVPTAVTPAAGTQLVNGTAGAVQLGTNLNLQAAFGRTTLQLPANAAGTTQRLVFSWRNDGLLGAQAPAVVDNVTATTRALSPLSGAYTINNAQPTAGTNFASFTDAATRLNVDGISGPVTFTVSGGPYAEQFLLNAVPGTSATNTIVVNGGGRTIQYPSASSSQRAVVQLNGTDYTTINNLNIDATGGTYGYGVLLTNAADNDRITNNVINADIATTSTSFAGIVVSGSATSATTSGNAASNTLIEGNTVNGGYYGITLLGASATALNAGNVIRNNNVRDFYTYGVYTSYQDGLQVVGNDVARPLRTNGTTFYGLYFSLASRGLDVEKNRLHDLFTGNPTSTSTAYPLYISTSTAATAAVPNDFVNNVFYNLNGAGTLYTIYSSSAAYSRIYNNTISADDQTATSTSTTYGIYSSGLSADIKNNVVSITRPGTGTKYGLYYVSNAPASNYNDIYVPSGNVGYLAAAYPTLANWQAANGGVFDRNSVSVDPVFAGITTGNLTPGNVLLNNAGTPLARVTDDITGATRGATPDLGAYEFAPVAVDVAASGLLTPATGATCYSAAEALSVQIRNAGTAALNFAANAATVTVVVTPPTGAAQTFTAGLNTGTLASGATQAVALPGTLNMAAPGTYSFAITATVVGDGNPANNALAVAPTRTVVAPVAAVLSPGTSNLCFSGSTTLTLTGAANGSTQLQSSSSATGPFADVAGATGATYTTPVLTSSVYYRVRTTCGPNTVYSNVATVAVNQPGISAAPSPLTVCAGTTASLSATVPAGIGVRYFTTATGGTPVGTGNPYVTPVLTASATYYAEAFAGGASLAGLPDNSAGNGTFTQSVSTDYPLGFSVTQARTLVSVDVYPTAAGNLTIRLYTVPSGQPGAGVAVAGSDVTVPITAAQVGTRVTVPLNYALQPGDYKLSNATGGLGRYSTYTGSYPLTSADGVLSVTGSYTFSSSTTYSNTTYNGFFNLRYGTECVSPGARTPIQVNVTPGLVATLGTATAALCGPTPYTLNGAVSGLATGGLYTSSGTGTFAPSATALNATYTPSAADVAAGTVTITLTPTGSTAACSQTARTVLSLTSPPNAAFSYPVAVYCTNSPATIAPVFAAGASAGTFTVSGLGLRINPTTGVINLATTNINGTFTITNTVTATGPCVGLPTSTASTTVTVIFGVGQPTLAAIPQPGGAVLLSTSPLPGITYQFYRTVGGTATAVGAPNTTGTLLLNAGAQSGSYTVVASSAQGCSSVPSVAVTATVLGVQTATLAGVSLRVYPNPTADGQLSVELSGINAKASQLTVLNALGQVVHTGTVPAGTAQLKLGQLAAGVYTFRVLTEQGVLTQRVVRQ